MTELSNAALLLVVLLCSSAAGLFIRPLLSERHITREIFELIQLVTTMLVTFAALVLGLLTSSAKTSFDRVGNDLRGLQRPDPTRSVSARLWACHGPGTRTPAQLHGCSYCKHLAWGAGARGGLLPQAPSAVGQRCPHGECHAWGH